MQRQRNLRKKVKEVSDDEDTDLQSKIKETKILQQLRKRQTGLSITADKQSVFSESNIIESSEGGLKALDAFSASSTIAKTEDEDPHMQKYIEEQLALRLGKRSNALREEDPEERRKKAEQDLYTVPEELRSKATEDNAVAGMVTTLCEVSLPDESRMRNIAMVEAVKRQMLVKVGVKSVIREEEEERLGFQQSRLRRGQFISSFGNASHQRKKPRLPPDEHLARLERDQRVVRGPRGQTN